MKLLKNIIQKNTTAEVLARIIKAKAKSFGYGVTIDFSEGRQSVVFHGPKRALKAIIEEIRSNDGNSM